MLPRQKQLCREITEAYKPWVKDGGIQWLFRDAYTRVGLRWALWSEKDAKAVKCGRMKAARAARRATRYVPAPRGIPDSILQDYDYHVASCSIADNPARTSAVDCSQGRRHTFAAHEGLACYSLLNKTD